MPLKVTALRSKIQSKNKVGLPPTKETDVLNLFDPKMFFVIHFRVSVCLGKFSYDNDL